MCIENFDITKLPFKEVTTYTPTNSVQEYLFPYRHLDTVNYQKMQQTLNYFPNGNNNWKGSP